MQTRDEKEIVMNSKVKDSGAKLIFGDNRFCAEFIRDYIDIPYAKDVTEEDIEDVSEQFVPLFSEERNADVVKRINVNNGNPFFFISLLEHKTKVDYNVIMQIFRYMIFIWDAYEKEMEKKEKGISKRADFKYPPIIPIVYYEGNSNWTVPRNFKSCIKNGELFGKYVPDFEYYLVPLREYTNEELMNHGDGISFLMMINKLNSEADIDAFRKLSPQRLEEIVDTIPDYQRDIIANVFLAALMKMQMPMEEALGLVGRVKEKKMAELFEGMEINILATRQELEESYKRQEFLMRGYVETLKELKLSNEEIVQKLKETYKMSESEAIMTVEQY